jgi:ATP:corrinoid adenosyltransferase
VGEYRALRRLGIDVVTLEEFGNPQAMWESVLEVSDSYDLVLLDEFNYAVKQGFIAPGEVLRLRDVKQRVVVTSNHLWPELAEVADFISEIRAVKHYYPKATGVKGLDW